MLHQHAAHQGTGKATERECAMQEAHHRFADAALYRDAMRVHGYIHAARDHAKHETCEHEDGDIRRCYGAEIEKAKQNASKDGYQAAA